MVSPDRPGFVEFYFGQIAHLKDRSCGVEDKFPTEEEKNRSTHHKKRLLESLPECYAALMRQNREEIVPEEITTPVGYGKS